jgi:hypothetical protein
MELLVLEIVVSTGLVKVVSCPLKIILKTLLGLGESLNLGFKLGYLRLQ